MLIPPRLRLLLVDDEARFTRPLAQRLELRGFTVTVAQRGLEAIAAAREAEFDLVVLDLRMPGLSGEDTLRLLREEHPFLEVIVLTGHGSIDSALRCIRLGARHYLQKPCSTETLLTVLGEALELRLRRRIEALERELEAIEVDSSSPEGDVSPYQGEDAR